MSYEYRTIEQGDIAALTRINVDAFLDYPLFTLPKDEIKRGLSFEEYLRAFMEVFIRAFLRKNGGLVCTENGRIVAHAMLRDPLKGEDNVWDYIRSGGLKLLKYRRLSDALQFIALNDDAEVALKPFHDAHWHLISFAVDPACQGAHLGAEFLERGVFPYIKENGGKGVTLTTNVKSNCAFYEKHGFRLVEERDVVYRGKSLANWCYCLTF